MERERLTIGESWWEAITFAWCLMTQLCCLILLGFKIKLNQSNPGMTNHETIFETSLAILGKPAPCLA